MSRFGHLTLVMLMSLGVCSIASAQGLSGVWKFKNKNCQAEVEIKQTDTSLVIEKRTYLCDGTSAVLPRLEYKVHNGRVQVGGRTGGSSLPGIIKFSTESDPNSFGKRTIVLHKSRYFTYFSESYDSDETRFSIGDYVERK